MKLFVIVVAFILVVPLIFGAEIIELLPNPVGKDKGNEWIIVKHVNNSCYLEDKKGNRLALNGSDMVYTEGKFTLNNVKETIYLVCDGVVVDNITYSYAKEGEVIAHSEMLLNKDSYISIVSMPNKLRYGDTFNASLLVYKNATKKYKVEVYIKGLTEKKKFYVYEANKEVAIDVNFTLPCFEGYNVYEFIAEGLGTKNTSFVVVDGRCANENNIKHEKNNLLIAFLFFGVALAVIFKYEGPKIFGKVNVGSDWRAKRIRR